MTQTLTVTYSLTQTLHLADPLYLKACLPMGADVMSIDGREFVAFCARCQRPICEGDGWHLNEDVYHCRACGWQARDAEARA